VAAISAFVIGDPTLPLGANQTMFPLRSVVGLIEFQKTN
jgi:hypothetical protein